MFDNLKKTFKPISADDEVDMNDTGLRNELTAMAKWEKVLKEKNIDKGEFICFKDRKGIEAWRLITLELIDEFQNLDNLIENVTLPCELSLNESFSDVNNTSGAVLSATTGKDINLTKTARKRVNVDTSVYIAEKGVVFKGAINCSQDLRIAWEEITDCKLDSNYSKGYHFLRMDIMVDDTSYGIEFRESNLLNTLDMPEMFFEYVKTHMSGVVDDGWA